MKRGITLIEIMVAVALFAILAVATVLVFRAILLSWASQETRAGIDIALDVEVEEVVRDLREATAISSVNSDEVRFTAGGSDYIYYFYNENDSYPPVFDQSTYELKKTALTGGISGTFTYGDGRIIIFDLIPPGTGTDPKTDLSIDANNLITVILKMTRGDETITSKTQVRPRNL